MDAWVGLQVRGAAHVVSRRVNRIEQHAVIYSSVLIASYLYATAICSPSAPASRGGQRRYVSYV